MNIIKPKSAVKAAFVAAAMLATPAAILGVSVPSASASAGQATLMPGEVLSSGQSLIDGPYTMAMQTDGNFVLYANGNQALWQSHTYNNPGSDVAMQTDGNLVVYSSGGQALWQSGTYNQPGDHLVVQTDGNAVIYTPSSRAAWATNTAQPAATSVSAGTATARTLTNCDSWHVFYGGQPEWTVCLTSNDWFNGSQVATNWSSPSCNVLWIERYSWSCQGYNYGHFWNGQIQANTDWIHERIGITGTIVSECANLNLNTQANGNTWTSDNIYPVWPWQSC